MNALDEQSCLDPEHRACKAAGQRRRDRRWPHPQGRPPQAAAGPLHPERKGLKEAGFEGLVIKDRKGRQDEALFKHAAREQADGPVANQINMKT